MFVLTAIELVELEELDDVLVSLVLDDVRDVLLSLEDELLVFDGWLPKSQPARAPTTTRLSNTVLIDFFILRFLSSTGKSLLLCGE